MKIVNEDNITLEPSDWRWSASIIGLLKYFTYHDIEHEIKGETLSYKSDSISEDKYLEFVEYYYGDKLHHMALKNMLYKEVFTEEDIKSINEKLKANTVMKNVMGKTKFDGNNKSEILQLIEQNKQKLIKETFRNKNDMYKNYCNVNTLGTLQNDSCRVVGYNLDIAKKGKAASYNFDKVNFVYQDEIEFDFIPFAFVGEREMFFINANSTIESLNKSNSSYGFKLEGIIKAGERVNTKKILFAAIIESKDYLNCDMEVMVKSTSKDYFKALYIHKKSIRILREIQPYYDVFTFSEKISEDYYLDIQSEVIDCILNNLRTDELIEYFLKNNKRNYVISKLIELNILIEEGGNEMEKRTKIAYACAKKVVGILEENKLASYRQKLTSAIVFNDYDRVCEILLQLSNYSNVSFDFAYDLFEDFEANKDVAYSFVNALNKYDNKQGEKGGYKYE